MEKSKRMNEKQIATRIAKRLLADPVVDNYAIELQKASDKLENISKKVRSKSIADFNKQKAKRSLKQLKLVLGLLTSNFKV